ncbi:hypothetical protein GCM10009802_33660 [Streptomyces synnematoformans]|uniref:Uncharacterized protein n=1 Tax=Streptomyces synnematoformans TaxID=415721 RepID=A0ABN2YI28_9ACTN
MAAAWRPRGPGLPSPVAKRRARRAVPGGRLCQGGRMTVGFSGDVAEYYVQYRRGYPSEVLDIL